MASQDYILDVAESTTESSQVKQTVIILFPSAVNVNSVEQMESLLNLSDLLSIR